MAEVSTAYEAILPEQNDSTDLRLDIGFQQQG